jgi:hypothetical protein
VEEGEEVVCEGREVLCAIVRGGALSLDASCKCVCVSVCVSVCVRKCVRMHVCVCACVKRESVCRNLFLNLFGNVCEAKKNPLCKLVLISYM